MADICAKDIIDYIAYLGPVIAAFIACGLAWWQGDIQARQKNISLLDNRLKLMKEIDNYIESFRNKLTKLPNDDAFWNTYIEQTRRFFDYKTKSKIFYNAKISNLVDDVEQLIMKRQDMIIDLDLKNRGNNKNIFCIKELVENYNQLFNLKKKISDEILSFIERGKI